MNSYLRFISFVVIWFVFFSAANKVGVDKQTELRVIYFLSPGCTICQFYTLRMRELTEKYADTGVEFQGVFSASSCNDVVIDEFKAKYQIPFSIYCDTVLHEQLNATVTPEVFIMNEKDEILYSGRIDDSYAAIGKRRPRVKHHELTDALDALLLGDTVVVKRTQPVGCIIQK